MAEDSPTGYAIGWEVIDHPEGYRVVTHTGGMLGVATALILVPKEDLAVVVLTNGVGMVLAGRGPPHPYHTAQWKGIPDPPEPDPPPFKPTPELVGTWTGYVHTYVGTGRSACSSSPMGISCSRLATRCERGEQGEVGRRHSEGRPGELNTPDLQRHEPYGLDLNLQVRGTELTGSVTATGIVIDVGNARHFALQSLDAAAENKSVGILWLSRNSGGGTYVGLFTP